MFWRDLLLLIWIVLLVGQGNGQVSTVFSTSTELSTTTPLNFPTCCDPRCPACALGSSAQINIGNGGCRGGRCPCVGCTCCYTITINSIYTSLCTSFLTKTVTETTTATFLTYSGTMFTETRFMAFTILDTIFFTDSVTSTSFVSQTQTFTDELTDIITVSSTIFLDSTILSFTNIILSSEQFSVSPTQSFTNFQSVLSVLVSDTLEVTEDVSVLGTDTATAPTFIFFTSSETLTNSPTITLTAATFITTEIVDIADSSLVLIVDEVYETDSATVITTETTLTETIPTTRFLGGTQSPTITMVTVITEPNPISFTNTLELTVTVTTAPLR